MGSTISAMCCTKRFRNFIAIWNILQQQVYPEWNSPIPSFLRFGSWIGGDRDGNPFVTADATWKTLQRQSKTILDLHLHAVDELFVEYSESAKVVGRSDELLQSIRDDKTMLGKPAQVRNDDEVYRVKLAYIYRRLQFRIHYAEDDASHAELMYHSSSELLDDLHILDRSLRAHKGELQANGLLKDLIRNVETFGFHLATLDVRQHRTVHAGTISELSSQRGIEYAQLNDEQRERWLTEELLKQSVPSFEESKLSPMSVETLAVFRKIKRAQTEIDEHAVRSYVISMTEMRGRCAGGALPDEMHGTILDRDTANTQALLILFRCLRRQKTSMRRRRRWSDCTTTTPIAATLIAGDGVRKS